MEASSPLKALLATKTRAKGMGDGEPGRYSNPKMDAVSTGDGKRLKRCQSARSCCSRRGDRRPGDSRHIQLTTAQFVGDAQGHTLRASG